jgi:hypothetical protein
MIKTICGKMAQDTRCIDLGGEIYKPSDNAGAGILFLRGERVTMPAEFAGYLMDETPVQANPLPMAQAMQDKQVISSDDVIEKTEPKKRGRPRLREY